MNKQKENFTESIIALDDSNTNKSQEEKSPSLENFTGLRKNPPNASAPTAEKICLIDCVIIVSFPHYSSEEIYENDR